MSRLDSEAGVLQDWEKSAALCLKLFRMLKYIINSNVVRVHIVVKNEKPESFFFFFFLDLEGSEHPLKQTENSGSSHCR